MDGRVEKWKSARMEEWKNGRKDGWMDGYGPGGYCRQDLAHSFNS